MTGVDCGLERSRVWTGVGHSWKVAGVDRSTKVHRGLEYGLEWTVGCFRPYVEVDHRLGRVDHGTIVDHELECIKDWNRVDSF